WIVSRICKEKIKGLRRIFTFLREYISIKAIRRNDLMQYNIRGHNIEVTAALRDYVEKKLSRVEKYFNTAPTAPANVSLSVLKDEHTVEVTIPFPGVL